MLPAEEPVPRNGRKRLCTDEDEDGYANKLCNGEQEEEEEGQKVVDDKNENQENNNGDEDKKEDDENDEAEEGKEDGIEEEDRKTEELDEGEQEEPGGSQDGNRGRKRSRILLDKNDDDEKEHRQNAGLEDNTNHQNSEQNESGNQESEGNEGEENDDQDDDEEEEDEEERRRRAAEKGEQTMYETCTLESVVHEFDDIIQGGPSETPEKEQTPDYFDEDHLYLAILRAMWKFKCNSGNFPNPPSVQLINHIMNSIPNLKISRAEVREKIKKFEDTFYEVMQMDGDNPAMHQLMDQEIFYLCMQLWGNQPQIIHYCLIYIRIL
ncbi:acidic leucine-rich nuclear phosphoprotein 32 family member B-like [Capsicum chacoense]